ncbi:MAG: hypothetical protein Q8830_04045, partial [Candidatus Phytoplasma australasiaticum]|nr:hypothetical protein [Candidatus Phytoplasma australasiaticum]
GKSTLSLAINNYLAAKNLAKFRKDIKTLDKTVEEQERGVRLSIDAMVSRDSCLCGLISIGLSIKQTNTLCIRADADLIHLSPNQNKRLFCESFTELITSQ